MAFVCESSIVLIVKLLKGNIQYFLTMAVGVVLYDESICVAELSIGTDVNNINTGFEFRDHHIQSTK